MPICQKCGESWTWSQTLKRVLSFRRIMKCPNCSETQYESQSSRYKSSFMMLVPILLLPLFIWFELSILHVLLIDSLIILIILGMLPFSTRLSNKDEAMW